MVSKMQMSPTSPIPNDISVIIVTHNSEAVIEQCLESLGREAWIKKIIVDCGSTDSTLSRVSRFLDVSVVETSNVGYGRGNNIGVSESSTDLVLILNPDVILTPDQLAKLVDFYYASSQNMVLSCKMFQRLKSGQKKYRRDSQFIELFREEKRLCGALMLISKKDFNKLKGFDEKIFLYFEEVDLCRRARNIGMQVVIFGGVAVEHLRAASTPRSEEYNILRGWHDGWSKAYYSYKKANSSIFGNIFVIKSLLQSALKYVSAKLARKKTVSDREAWKIRGCLAFLRGEGAFDDQGRPRYLP